ncbi:MAG: 2-hydroxyacid dehydrogenase [Phycisphaerales bacterium]
MDAIVYSTKRFDRESLASAASHANLTLQFLEHRLTAETAVLAEGRRVACLFVNDVADAEAIGALAAGGVELLALRSAGFNHVDLDAATRAGMVIARVPAYSPHGVAEHAAALLLSLNRKIHKAYLRVREGNFSIDGLMGFDLAGRTVGVVGLGKIGRCFARIMVGFGCTVLAFDPAPEADGIESVQRVDLDELLRRSDIVSLHCPLTPETFHMIDDDAVSSMRPGAMLINTSRGALIDTNAAIRGLKSGRLGSLGLDVYEEEGDLFFQDLSDRVLQDDVLARLLTFPNVLVTSHQAFFTREAVDAIAATTVRNIAGFLREGAAGIPEANRVSAEVHVKKGR